MKGKNVMASVETACQVPRLCGGVFLALLDAAKKSTAVTRKQFGAKGSGISFTEMLMDLVRIADPSRNLPDRNSLKGLASNYRKCELVASTYFPFNDIIFVSAFSERMETQYHDVYSKMYSFVSTYFDTGNESACHKLVAGLLETIFTDDTIADTDQFAYLDGQLFFKAAFCDQDQYDLTSFLLAVWFFIVQNRRDNTVGRATFLAWHVQVSDRAPWKYCGNAGKHWGKAFTVGVNEPFSQKREDSSDADESTRSETDVRAQDISRVNDLWEFVRGQRLNPIKKEDKIAPDEMGYVYPLYAAYGQHLKRSILCKEDLTPMLQRDLEIRRQHFFEAETVRVQGELAIGRILRDEFDDLKNDILSSVWNTYVGTYPDGYRRMTQVMNEAGKAACTKGNLIKTGWIGSGEKQGITHMLAADKVLIWEVDEDE